MMRIQTMLATVLATVAFGGAMSAQTAEKAPDALAGLWGVEAAFGLQAQGELTLDARGGAWQARLAGYQVDVKLDKNRVQFSLPGDNGEFRGQLHRVSNVIRGEWIQPPGKILQNPYATPVELRPVAASVWQGRVVPLEQRISVYADIRADAAGKITAVLANPEMNFFRKRVFAVTQDGDKVHLDAKGWKIEGTYDAKSDQLSLQLVDFLPPFQFSRRSQKDAVGFYPRTPAGGEYRYQSPIAHDDGWTTGTLAQEHLDESAIRKLIDRILRADPNDSAWNIQSLLIARHGRLVVEEYFRGFDGERPHDMRSASKTFAPVLVGVAREHGVKLSPATPVYPEFRQYQHFENWDARKQAVTLRDIMTMTAGNACDDNDDDSPGNEDRMQQDPANKDWYKYTLDLPMLRAPGGENAVYCSGDLNLVGGVVASANGAWLPEFFEDNLAKPLQFGRYYLNLMPDGQAYMGGGARLLPRDELKLGQLILNGGTWNGRRILSKAWVEESTSTHARFDPKFSLGQEHQYGYGWHIHNLQSGARTYRALSAGGNGGQFVVAIPELDMVIGINGGAYGEFANWYKWELELIPQFVIPAVSDGAGR